MGIGRTSAARVKITERRTKVLALRTAGMSYRAIADRLRGKDGVAEKYNFATAYDDVKAMLDEANANHREQAEDIRALEMERLDAMHMALWADAARGNHGAIDRVLRVMERRAKLLGLDAPTKAQLAGVDGGDITIKVVYDNPGSAPENGAPDAT